MSNIICQMYGLRKEIEKDPYTCFRKVKEMGFDAIQLDGMRGVDPTVILDAVKKADLRVDSMHIKHDRFIFDVDGIIEEGKMFQCREVYLKYIEDEFQVEYGYKFTRYALIKAAEKLEAAGFTVGFHSPEYDFNTLVDDKKVMDYICGEAEGITIHPEPDTYWLSVAQVDPLAYMKQYSGKILTVHMKDINTDFDLMDMENNLEPCGRGKVDFESVMRWGEANGVRSYAVEQDSSRGDIYEDMKFSLSYLQKLKEKINA